MIKFKSQPSFVPLISLVVRDQTAFYTSEQNRWKGNIDYPIALIGWDGSLLMNLRVKLTMCFFFVSLNDSLPNYLNECLVIHNTQHNRRTRYVSYNSMFPYYKRETEGGCSLLYQQQDFGIMCP